MDQFIPRVSARRYLAWRFPGHEEAGRVELIPSSNINDAEHHLPRTLEEAVIPKGCVVYYKEEAQPTE